MLKLKGNEIKIIGRNEFEYRKVKIFRILDTQKQKYIYCFGKYMAHQYHDLYNACEEIDILLESGEAE